MKRTVILLLLLCSCTFAQRADFFREDITFRLDSLRLDVDGYYWFTNHSGKPVTSEIYYPFPDYAGGMIDSVRLFNISDSKKTSYVSDGRKGIYFTMEIAPMDTILFQIGYRQELNKDSAVYILTSTQQWGKAISLAEYKLIVPDSVKVKRFSYPPLNSYKFEDFSLYYWKIKNFMPDKNMIFYFR